MRELTGAAANLQGGVQRLTDPNVPFVGWLLEKARDYVDIDRDSARQFLANRMQAWGALLASSTLVVVGGAVGAVAQMALVVFTMFYLFRDGDRLRRRGLRDAAARARADPLDHRPDAGRHRGDALRRPGDLADPGNARHVHLLGAGAAVAAAVGRRDVLPVDDSDGRVVPGVGAGRDVPRADRLARQGRRPGRLGHPGHRIDRQLPVAAAGRQARAAARAADFLLGAGRAAGLRRARPRARPRRRRDHAGADRDGSRGPQPARPRRCRSRRCWTNRRPLRDVGVDELPSFQLPASWLHPLRSLVLT